MNVVVKMCPPSLCFDGVPLAHTYRYWPYGSEGCQTHGFQGFMTALASIHFIAAIAWDRYHQYCTSKSARQSVRARVLLTQIQNSNNEKLFP